MAQNGAEPGAKTRNEKFRGPDKIGRANPYRAKIPESCDKPKGVFGLEVTLAKTLTGLATRVAAK